MRLISSNKLKQLQMIFSELNYSELKSEDTTMTGISVVRYVAVCEANKLREEMKR